jgi:hypothetical protein
LEVGAGTLRGGIAAIGEGVQVDGIGKLGFFEEVQELE